MTNQKIRVGVSSCLLGEKVRWNGQHKQDHFVRNVLGNFFDWVPSCPEVEIGMGIPRETVRLTGTAKSPHMEGSKSGKDWTAKMNEYSKKRTKELAKKSLCGYIFQKKSPSCGIYQIPILSKTSDSVFRGPGLFAGHFMKDFPLVPTEEEGRLNDPKIRENFIVRIFAYHRLQEMMSSGLTRGKLVKFHSTNKYLLLAHSPKHYSKLGRYVADSKKKPITTVRNEYSKLFMEALSLKATTKKNTNVLEHMYGFLKDKVAQDEKKDILETIRDYQKKLVPLIVPITLIKHYVKKHKIDYLLDQVYLNPHPKELMLRNHV